MRLRPVFTALVLATLIEAPARAADPAVTCSASKGKAVGKNVYDQMKCEATAAREGSVDPSCIEKAAVIVTTNLPFSEWTQVIPNARLCKALIDASLTRQYYRNRNRVLSLPSTYRKAQGPKLGGEFK